MTPGKKPKKATRKALHGKDDTKAGKTAAGSGLSQANKAKPIGGTKREARRNRIDSMTGSRRVDVIYSEDRWLAAVAPDFESEFEGKSLTLLLKAMQQALPIQALVFVIDKSTIEGNADARNQFVEAREETDIPVILSVQEF